MAKFIKFNLTNGAAAQPASPVDPLLINVDNIVKYVATGAAGVGAAKSLVIYMKQDKTGIKNVEITATTATSGAAVNPTFKDGELNPLIKAFTQALTANPGGVTSLCQLGKDNNATPKQMYWRAATWA